MHAWVGQNLLKCNELRPILRDRGRFGAGASSAAAADAAATNRRCYGTDRGPVRAITSSFWVVCLPFDHKCSPRTSSSNRLCAKRTWWACACAVVQRQRGGAAAATLHRICITTTFGAALTSVPRAAAAPAMAGASAETCLQHACSHATVVCWPRCCGTMRGCCRSSDSSHASHRTRPKSR